MVVGQSMLAKYKKMYAWGQELVRNSLFLQRWATTQSQYFTNLLHFLKLLHTCLFARLLDAKHS